nr:MAG TPA: hypothetical protein [Siphoviridae sp. ctvzh6]DAS23414.1 MAG TPA: hypothetical protein [Caudoviricetes sp.]
MQIILLSTFYSQLPKFFPQIFRLFIDNIFFF